MGKRIERTGKMIQKLQFVIPCFNEEDVLRGTSHELENKLMELKEENMIAAGSGLFFVDDGSSDLTWEIIKQMSAESDNIHGISLSKNYGQQTAIYAGLMNVKDTCDIAISIDADGQHDPDAIEEMIHSYENGSDIVCAVRNNRNNTLPIKDTAASLYYSMILLIGTNIIRNHADFRLMSSKAISMLEEVCRKPVFLRGEILKLPLKISTVEYRCKPRCGGKSKYSVAKMLKLAIDGLISLQALPNTGAKEKPVYIIKERT